MPNLRRCQLVGKSHVALAKGLAHNRTLHQLQLSGSTCSEAAQVALCKAIAGHKALEQVNLAFCKLCPAAVECLAQVTQCFFIVWAESNF
jgi:hypothetical protein